MKQMAPFRFNISGCTVCLLFLIQYGALAQSPKFSLVADKLSVSVGESFVLEAVMENMDGDDVSFPDVAPFRVVQGPANSSQYSLINGKRSTKKSTRYVLLAVKEGRFTIPPATTRIGTRVIKSNALSVTVRKGEDSTAGKSGPPQTTDQETFIVAEISADQAWVGQQLLLDIVLYTRQEVTSYNILEARQHNAFYYEPVSDLRQQGREVTLGGKRYVSYVLKRDRLYARRAGEFVLEPCQVSLELVGEDAQSFFFQDVHAEVFASKGLQITVKDLPQPPADFSGAVGEFTLDAALVSPGTATDVCKIQVIVEGDGDARSWMIPPFTAPGNLASYDPVVLKEESIPTEGKGIFHREIEYTFTAQKDTAVQIQPRLVYFSPEKEMYVTLTKDLGVVQLKARKPGTSAVSGKLPDIQAWKTEETLRHHSDAIWASFKFYLFFGILCLAFVFVLWVLPKLRRKSEQGNLLVKDYIQQRSPDRLLSLAEKYAKEGEFDSFYVVAEEICLLFCQQFTISDLSVVRSSDNAFLFQAGVKGREAELLRQIVHCIDTGKFAGQQVNFAQMLSDMRELLSLSQKYADDPS